MSLTKEQTVFLTLFCKVVGVCQTCTTWGGGGHQRSPCPGNYLSLAWPCRQTEAKSTFQLMQNALKKHTIQAELITSTNCSRDAAMPRCCRQRSLMRPRRPDGWMLLMYTDASLHSLQQKQLLASREETQDVLPMTRQSG